MSTAVELGPLADQDAQPHRPRTLGFAGLFNVAFGMFGIQVAFALQGANVSRIFQTLGAQIDDLPILWIAAPLTGLVVQPFVGYYSDRTWSRRLGRRRPYFLAGTVLSCMALIAFPFAHQLWIAVALLWLLDGSINVAMEPFRAFIAEVVSESQRTAGFAFQTVFIGTGAVLASLLPALLHRHFDAVGAAAHAVPASVGLAFYIGAAALAFAVGWTVVTTPEFPPGPSSTLHADRPDSISPPRRGGRWLVGGLAIAAGTWFLHLHGSMLAIAGLFTGYGLMRLWTAARARTRAKPSALAFVLADLDAMPATMRKLALVQFCTWFGLFVLWIFATPVVTAHAFGAAEPRAPGYAEGADWVGVMFAVYNAVAAFAAFALPALARWVGPARTHQGALMAGAAGFAGLFVLTDKYALLLPMVGIGIAWAGVLTLPYTILCEACPPERLGGYMGLFNIFITLPQLFVSTVMGVVMSALFPHAPQGAMLIAAAALTLAAVAMQRLITEGHRL